MGYDSTALQVAGHQEVTFEDVRYKKALKQEADRLLLAKFSMRLDKLLAAEALLGRRLIAFCTQCSAAVPPVGSQVLSERELKFPALLFAAQVYEYILTITRTKLAKEFLLTSVTTVIIEEHRYLGKRIQMRSADLRGPLWKLLPKDTQRVTSIKTWVPTLTVKARSFWDGGTPREGQHGKTVSCTEWFEAIAKKILGVPGVLDRRSGVLNVEKLPEVPVILKLASALGPVFAHARAVFFADQTAQELLYQRGKDRRCTRVEAVEVPVAQVISELVTGDAGGFFGAVSHLRQSDR